MDVHGFRLILSLSESSRAYHRLPTLNDDNFSDIRNLKTVWMLFD